MTDHPEATDDLVERLRRPRGILKNEWPGPTVLDLKAAYEIETLRARLTATEVELQAARKALEVDGNDIWEAYMVETPYRKYRSPQGAIAFTIDFLRRSLKP